MTATETERGVRPGGRRPVTATGGRAIGTAQLYRTSIGKKSIMAGSGLILVLFVIGHMLGNLHTFQGPNQLNDYGDFLRRMGEPLFPRSLLLWIVRVVVATAFVLHVYFAIDLSVKSRRARRARYAHPDHVQADIPAVTMRWGGLALGLFVVFHLANLTWGWVHPSFTYVRGDVYNNVVGTFNVEWITAVYLAAMVALCLHIYHGAWSMFQTFGVNNQRWDTIIRRTAGTVAVVVFLGYLSVPIGVLTGLVS
jgi:succinate dehydrogenase / fumarate reductase cytochrome b subunit